MSDGQSEEEAFEEAGQSATEGAPGGKKGGSEEGAWKQTKELGMDAAQCTQDVIKIKGGQLTQVTDLLDHGKETAMDGANMLKTVFKSATSAICGEEGEESADEDADEDEKRLAKSGQEEENGS